MGKTIDPRVIEYAYVSEIKILLNQEAGKEFIHGVYITYELKDEKKGLLNTVRKDHVTDPTEAMESVSDYTKKIAELLSKWIAEDKFELSGYKS